jgi:hypothetical protein
MKIFIVGKCEEFKEMTSKGKDLHSVFKYFFKNRKAYPNGSARKNCIDVKNSDLGCFKLGDID